jgi:hypothetical protein
LRPHASSGGSQGNTPPWAKDAAGSVEREE